MTAILNQTDKKLKKFTLYRQTENIYKVHTDKSKQLVSGRANQLSKHGLLKVQQEIGTPGKLINWKISLAVISTSEQYFQKSHATCSTRSKPTLIH